MLLLLVAIAPGLVAGCGSESSSQPDPVRTGARVPAPAKPNPTAAQGLERCIANATGDTDRMPQLVRGLCQEMLRSDTPGASLAIATADGASTSIAAGRRCADGPQPVLPSTPFRIGSITKSLMAASTVAYASRGMLDLDAAVALELPGLSPAYAAITWRQLLDHTTGLPDTAPAPHLVGLSALALTTALSRGEAIDEPGAQHHYANANYVLLGMALSRRTGIRDVDLVRAVVAAGSDNPQLPIEASEHPREHPACGHLAGTQLSVHDDLALLAAGARWTFPAGGAVMSAQQLARAALALASESPTDLHTDRTTDTQTQGWRYALGMRRRTLADGSQHWFHAGATGDFAADLHILPDRGIAVVVLANAGTHLRASAFAGLAAAAPGVDLSPPPQPNRHSDPLGER